MECPVVEFQYTNGCRMDIGVGLLGLVCSDKRQIKFVAVLSLV